MRHPVERLANDVIRGCRECWRIEDLLDFVLSVEEVKLYKPHPIGLSTRRGSSRPYTWSSTLLSVSSKAGDAYAAKAFGLRVIGVIV